MTELSEGLAARGHDVTVLTSDLYDRGRLAPSPPAGRASRDTFRGVKVVCFPHGRDVFRRTLERVRRIKGGYRFLNLLFGKDGADLIQRGPAVLELIPWVLRSDADIVLSIHWSPPHAYYAHIAGKLKPFIHVGIPFFHTATSWCQLEVYVRMLRRCNAVIVNTDHEGDFVRERSGTRTLTAGVGVHPEQFDGRNGKDIRAKYGLREELVVGYLSRGDRFKGITKVIDAMRIVWRRKIDAYLVIAGVRDLAAEGADQLMAQLGECERQRIVYIGEFDERDKSSIFDAFDVFVLPSLEESFGIVYLEAWMCRKPVIGSRIGPTECVIADGVDGLLVDPEDAEDIAAKIQDLLADKAKRDRMGWNGYQKTMLRFTWDKVIDQVERLFLELVEARRGRGESRATA